MQRLFDIVLSALAILVLSPLLLPLVIALRLSGEGEIFYRQRRVGIGARPFDLLKFATMLKNSPNLGAGNITVKGDPRILPMGQFLRKTKINELPQLFNILRGDMSIIGPRPMTPDNFLTYSPDVQAAIATVRPGLSGIGSIVFRDEEDMLDHAAGDPRHVHANVIGPYKGALEQWYVAHQSLWTYLALIGLTAFTVLRPQSRLVWTLFPSLPTPLPDMQSLFDTVSAAHGPPAAR